MIVFQQIRNATVKLQYPGGTFMIDPWLTDACDPIEREQAVAARRFIPKPVCPLPAPVGALVGDVDWFLLTHCHPHGGGVSRAPEPETVERGIDGEPIRGTGTHPGGRGIHSDMNDQNACSAAMSEE